MLFYRIYDNEVALTGTPTASVITAASLKQATDTWKNAYAYIASGNKVGEFRRITASSNAGALTLEYDLTGAPSAGDKIEILDWSPATVHEAIQRAIYDGYRAFPVVKENTSIVIEEDKLEYALSGITPAVWLPVQVWFENSPNAVFGVATGGIAGTLVDSTQSWATNEHQNKQISVYKRIYGLTAGEVRVVSNNNATTLYTTVDWSEFGIPEAGDKYCLWDAYEQHEDWYRLTAGRFSPEESPDYLRLTRRYPDFYGMRMRLVYIGGPDVLSSDTSTTTVNREFLVYQASAILHDMLVPDSTVNRSSHAAVAEYMSRIAKEVMNRHRKAIPPFNVWVEEDVARGFILPENIF